MSTVYAQSPLTPRSILARGVDVAYRERPGGPKNLLMLHGWCCSPEFFDHFVRGVPDAYRVVAMELWGRSGQPWGGWNVSALADQARDLLDALGIQQATVMGHSMGGVVAQLFALRYGGHLDRLVLLGTGPYRRGHRGGTGPRDILIERGLTRETAREILLHFFSRPVPEEPLERWIDYVVQAEPDALISAMNSNMGIDVVNQLPSIQAPTLVIHGSRDYGRPLEHAKALVNGIPDARLIVMDTGHAMMIDLPDEFDGHVLDFLSES